MPSCTVSPLTVYRRPVLLASLGRSSNSFKVSQTAQGCIKLPRAGKRSACSRNIMRGVAVKLHSLHQKLHSRIVFLETSLTDVRDLPGHVEAPWPPSRVAARKANTCSLVAVMGVCFEHHWPTQFHWALYTPSYLYLVPRGCCGAWPISNTPGRCLPKV